MPNLAGFGFIGEISIDTIRDFVNDTPQQIGGQYFYPLGGPFQLTVPLAAIPGLGVGTLQVMCNAQLDAVVKSANCQLTVQLSDGAVLFDTLSAFHLGGTATVVASLAIVNDTSAGAPPNQIIPAVLLSSALAGAAFDSQSQTLLANVFGASYIPQMNADLGSALQCFVRGMGDQSFEIPGAGQKSSSFAFKLVGGVDSHDPLTVPLMPKFQKKSAQILR